MKISELVETAQRLNAASDELNEAIHRVERILRPCGIEAWAPTTIEMDGHVYRLGWAFDKPYRNWYLMVRTDPAGRTRPLHMHSRQIRIMMAACLPLLFETIRPLIEAEITKLHGQTILARAIADQLGV